MPPPSKCPRLPPSWLQWVLIRSGDFRWWTNMSWQTTSPPSTYLFLLLPLHPFTFVDVTWRDSFVNPLPVPSLSICLPQPPDPILLLFHRCQWSWRDCCVGVCVWVSAESEEAGTKPSGASVHTGAAPPCCPRNSCQGLFISVLQVNSTVAFMCLTTVLTRVYLSIRSGQGGPRRHSTHGEHPPAVAAAVAHHHSGAFALYRYCSSYFLWLTTRTIPP